MKKVLLGFSAVIMVLSMVAAVSAYEAHVVNVNAKVENALTIISIGFWDDYEEVFPEEFLTDKFYVSTSSSFCEKSQWRVTDIDYEIWVDTLSGFKWLGDCLAFRIDNTPWVFVADLADDDPPIKVTTDHLTKKDINPKDGAMDDTEDTIHVGLDVPVFREYYNEFTDVPQKPSGKSKPSVIIETDDTWGRYHPDGVWLGAKIIIQVANIDK